MQDQPKTMQQLADELHSIIVQEIYPDILGKDSGLAFKVLSKMERKIYYFTVK